jgi:hypothetical protein
MNVRQEFRIYRKAPRSAWWTPCGTTTDDYRVGTLMRLAAENHEDFRVVYCICDQQERMSSCRLVPGRIVQEFKRKKKAYAPC